MNRNSEKDGRDKEINDVYAGKNPVAEALAAGVVFDTVFVTKKEGPNAPLIAKCVKAGATVKEAHPAKLDALSGGAIHQGIVAVASSAKPAELDDIFKAAEEKGEPALILIADDIQDPQNLGALIRSAECAGVHGVIIPKRRSASVTAAVAKASAGAVEYMRVARVANLGNAIDRLKQANVWIAGAHMQGVPMSESSLEGAVAFVIGGWAWAVAGLAAVVTVLYLVALRTQVREEQALRNHRIRQLRRARLGVLSAADEELAIPRHLRRPGAVILERDDESPDFDHLPVVESRFDTEPAPAPTRTFRRPARFSDDRRAG